MFFFIYSTQSDSPIDIFFFFNDTATTEIYTLSLHDALPICASGILVPSKPTARSWPAPCLTRRATGQPGWPVALRRSEEHTSELQSPCNLVCRLLLEKKKKAQHQTRRRHRPRTCTSPCASTS